MRSLVATLMMLLVCSAYARDDAAVPVRELIAHPAKYKGGIIVVRRIRCVDPGGAGFVCEATAGNERLRLDASILGAVTEQPIAEKLIGPCKGRAALTRSSCTFDVVLTPTSFGEEDGATVIYAQQIDMSAPSRR